MDTLCAIDGCGKPSRKRGWCLAHYTRWQRHGNPLAGRTEVGEPRRFLEGVLAYTGNDCIAWPFARDDKGYGQISQGGRMRRVSRIVCTAIRGPAPSSSYEAAHSCGNGHLACCTPRHLRWASHAENMADMVAHGSQAKGAQLARLSEAEASEVLRLKGTASQREIASRFGVDQSMISRIHSGKLWRHLHG